MESFLNRVARVYYDNERDNLLDYCFVFPNKRSSHFFAESLRKMCGPDSAVIFPRIMPVNEFVADFSPLVEATRYEQLFILYNEYNKISRDIEDFDRFQFWGEMLLNDFSDVDSYMIDASKLFVNVKRLKEINANYFTPEQLEVMKRFWGEVPSGYDPETFWSHIEQSADTGGEKFLKLWEILDPLYHAYRARMTELGLANTGMFARNCVERLSNFSPDDLYYKRYVFVGFNVLSTSELLIFEKLKALGCADFYWDFNSPSFEDKNNKAVRFIAGNVREFKSLYDLGEEKLTRFPNIEIIGVPSTIGQVKTAGEILAGWAADSTIKDVDNAIDTAVVLPDEQLFVQMIHSVPESISEVNVTMGYPMRHTPIASVMRTVISMHLRARSVKGEFRYFYEDLLQLIAQPLIRGMAPEDCAAISDMINSRHLFTISDAMLQAECPTLGVIFRPVNNVNDFDEVYRYTLSLAEFMLSAVRKTSDNQLDEMFIKSYIDALEDLKEASDRHRITMRENTFFHLIERAISGDTINFTGEPLKGLQIMGVLETRVLDFDNVIMLSMNERIFPRKHYTRSFIPDALRRAYGMSTVDFQESIYAYYFYRLLTRAKNVRLLYDARSVGGKSSEMSRFLAQLLYLYNTPDNPVEHTLMVYPQRTFDPPVVEIRKSPEVMKILEQYTVEGSGKNLSASSINEYINCPVNFYLKYVEGYNVEEDAEDFMDSSTYGTIIHEILHDLYTDFRNARGSKNGVVITADIIDGWIKSPVTLDRYITRSVNRHYNRLPDEAIDTPLKGEPEVLARIMKLFLIEMLNREKGVAPIEFIEGEHEIRRQLRINDSLTVNIRQYIDRIDRVDGRLRIVDYKTGSDVSDTSEVADMFDPMSAHRPKAMLQLMFYCLAYSLDQGIDQPIRPYLYCFKNIRLDGLKPLRIGGAVVDDYRDYIDEYLPRFNEIVAEIFNPDVPFRQSDNSNACTFCQFKGICAKAERRY